jgi:signal transduction histidine kinase
LIDLYLSLNEKFEVTACNQSVKEYLGKTEADILGETIWELFKTTISQKDVLAGLEAESEWKTTHIYSYNRIKYIFYMSIGKVFSSKSSAYIVHAHTKKEIDVLLEKKEEIFKEIQRMYEHIHGYFWTSNFDNGIETYFFPENIRKVTGYFAKEIEQLPGKLLYLIHKDDVSDTIKELNIFSSAGRKFSLILDYRIIRKDKQIRWIKESLSVQRDVNGKIISTAGIAIDITDLKEAQSKMERSESELKELNAAKDRFINILSHDLRAPFTSILGFSEILLAEPNLPLKEKNEYLNYIYDASQSQLQFINYLLDWSRLKTGSLKIEPQRLKAQGIIYQCISALTGNAIRKNIDIQVDIPDDLYIQVDERLLTQVILNILSNAIKFSFENSTIEINAALFNENQVEFVIKDFGLGIKTEDQGKIFSIDKSFTRDGTKGEKGSGFGLALVREIIEKHSGEIWFYSEENKGTEFHFTFPVPSNTILLVESDEHDRTMYMRTLTENFKNFKILFAENGYEAMNIIYESFPNLIIASHQMPLMNGIQLIESLKKGDSSLKYPIVIIGDDISDDSKKRYQQLGAKSVIEKPFNNDYLVKIISSTLS